MRSWVDPVYKFLLVTVPVVFIAAVIYMTTFIAGEKALLIPRKDVQVLKDWTYVDQMTGPESVTTPIKVKTAGRDVFVFKTVLPKELPDGCVIAFLNKADVTIEVGGEVIRQWTRDEAPIIGGPAKNSYFFTPLAKEYAGKEIKITMSGGVFGGKFFDAFVGKTYEVVRFLEIKNGAFLFGLSLALLVCSLVFIIAGLILQLLYRQSMKIVFMAMGIFVASSWMVTDSFVFQFLFRTQFIDGFMSYMTTLCIVFPFLAYLDAIQEYRYRKWYVLIGIAEFLNLAVVSILHITYIVNFKKSLLPLDAVIGLGIVAAFAITIHDIRLGNAVKYKYVAYGFLAFMVLSVIEIVLINTVLERVEGGVIIAGLYILFIFAIMQQIVEIRQVQVERDRANEEGQAKTKFLASMSHEIRTPINSILGMNEMILKESRDPNILNYAGIINDSGTMLLSLINDVLDVSKIENDMAEIVCVNYDPGKLFDNAAEMVRTQAAKKGLEVKIGKPRNLPKMLYGDEKRITQIVTNLLTNAVKYTEEGTVTFTGECFPNEDNYVLCFYVSDTGIGIKNEDKDSIFDPFHRLDLQKNQSIQGTGLGLSIVKSLIEKMNGQIHVESTYGKGSTFSVRIPQKGMDEETLQKYNSGNSVEDDDLCDIDDNYIAPDARILEVDDNTANQVVVREFLKQTGVQLDIASGGKEAVKLCKINKYDVILMDHMMPSPDGIETMHLIKLDPSGQNADTPQIVLTANALIGSRATYESEGFDNYLSKPIESERLIKMIRKYLPDSKVMYKPKRRTSSAKVAPEAAQTTASEGALSVSEEAKAAPVSLVDAPVDIPALIARFDGQEETARMILKEIIKEGERKIPLLRELIEKEDVKRYAIESHGVKGVMASSCINALSATAKKHELAAKEGNFEFCKSNIDSFLAEYQDVLDYINSYLEG